MIRPLNQTEQSVVRMWLTLYFAERADLILSEAELKLVVGSDRAIKIEETMFIRSSVDGSVKSRYRILGKDWKITFDLSDYYDVGEAHIWDEDGSDERFSKDVMLWMLSYGN